MRQSLWCFVGASVLVVGAVRLSAEGVSTHIVSMECTLAAADTPEMLKTYEQVFHKTTYGQLRKDPLSGKGLLYWVALPRTSSTGFDDTIYLEEEGAVYKGATFTYPNEIQRSVDLQRLEYKRHWFDHEKGTDSWMTRACVEISPERFDQEHRAVLAQG